MEHRKCNICGCNMQKGYYAPESGADLYACSEAHKEQLKAQLEAEGIDTGDEYDDRQDEYVPFFVYTEWKN